VITLYNPPGFPKSVTKLMGPKVTVWFSYETPVAVHQHGLGIRVRQNSWGSTTGRHMNLLDGGDKAKRLSSEDFEALLSQVVGL